MNTDYNLIDRLIKAKEELNNSVLIDDKIILINYINNISKYIDNNDKLCNKEEYNTYLEYIKRYENEMLNLYINNKEFHKRYLNEIIRIVEEELLLFNININNNKTKLNDNEFFTIIYDFMYSINLTNLIDKFYSNNNIYTYKINKDNKIHGYILHNYINNTVDMFIGDFSYNIDSLFVFIHEFGHIYDLSLFKESNKSYNKYIYQSFYIEVISKLFERLFLKYMIDNNILYNESITKLLELEIMNYDYLINSYIISLIDNNYILDNTYKYNLNEEIINKISKYFYLDNNHKNYLKTSSNFNILNDYSYAYGDILSMFIKEEGLNSNLLREVLNNRSDLFNKFIFESYELFPSKYKRLYKEETKVLKI